MLTGLHFRKIIWRKSSKNLNISTSLYKTLLTITYIFVLHQNRYLLNVMYYLSSRKVWIQQPMQQLFQQPGLNQDDPHQFCTLVVPLSCLPVFPSNHDRHLLPLPKIMSHVNVCWEFVNQKLQLQNCHCMLKIYVGY